MFDNPIFFLILISIISAISEWLGKRRKAKRMEEEMGPAAGEELIVEQPVEAEDAKAQRRRSVREQQEDWEERLRRMLEGDEAASEASAPRQQTEPERAQATVVTEAPRSHGYSQTQPSEVSFPVSMEPQPIERVQSVEVPEVPKIPSKGMARRRVPRKSRHGDSFVDNIGSKEAIRNAIVASVVLGPPKGSGEESDLLRL